MTSGWFSWTRNASPASRPIVSSFSACANRSCKIFSSVISSMTSTAATMLPQASRIGAELARMLRR